MEPPQAHIPGAFRKKHSIRVDAEKEELNSERK